MKIRRIQYNIDYVHILTFKEEYKQAVIPYFGFDNLRYGIDNENTINESIRLIFASDFMALFIRKDGLTIIYDGADSDLKNQNGIMKFFWEIYERIKNFQGYKKTTRHSIIAHAVDLTEKKLIEKSLNNNDYFSINPFGKLTEFGCNYEFKKDDKDYKFQFGNFSEKDIKVHDLRSLGSEYNKDLVDGLGFMCRVEIFDKCSTPNFSKFKALLSNAEHLISSYKYL